VQRRNAALQVAHAGHHLVPELAQPGLSDVSLVSFST
jgi:hypothetical protein